ncbi:efflux RND transporter periplasmic adaptor subunit [Hymenobacter convexus]|uniref:efflux RND transporter periplasmic adaptor subunit n=1 Tax=Hymenobacter sp. CA1UV-4 TaxID=3063782 RepID=UPI002712B650|nr:efflux RND transporter periplasmic adaptor subunit [Hymenobacter sp. CA1UV-4]MDO7854584.1 efflux RND transporter periplasmic adaptor subunit [Hymenobacter sp. CA1UV-4]
MRYIPLSLVLLGLLSGCGSQEAPTDKEETAAAPSGEAAEKGPADRVTLTAAEQQVGGVRLGTFTQRPMSGGLKVNGVLDVPPENLVSVSAPLGGFVDRTDLLQGSRVRAGQVLAVIRNPDFVQLQQDYLETRSQLKLARAEYERQGELYRQEVAPQKNFQRAQAEYEALQVKTNAQAARLRLAGLPIGGAIVSTATLRAPKGGFVKAVNVSIGQSVTPTDVLFEIVNPEHLHVELTVFEKDIPQVKENQLVRFSLGNDSLSRERTAHVYLISKTISDERTVRVHAHLDREDEQLLPGTFVRAVIETNRVTVPTLPEKAVVQYGAQSYVFVAADSAAAAGRATYRLVPVTRGVSEDGYTEFHLPATEQGKPLRFVVEGAYALLGKLKNAEEEE